MGGYNYMENKKRFGELQRAIPDCSKKMLVQQLDFLIEQGIIVNQKKLVNNVVESTYFLSESGLRLLPVMEKMIMWSNKNLNCDKY